MPAHATVHVYSLLLDRLGRGNGASLKDLKVHLEEHDLPKSGRTISRYIEQLRNEFGLDIIYDSLKRNYLIKKDGDFEIEKFLNLLTLSQMTTIDLGNPKKWREIQNVLQFDQIQQPKGILGYLNFQIYFQFKPLFGSCQHIWIVFLLQRTYVKSV